MEPLIVGMLSALTAVTGVVFWQLVVRPDTLLGVGVAAPGSGSAAVRALRYAIGTLLFLCAFGTGLTLAFLLST